MTKMNVVLLPKSVLSWNGGIDFFLYLLSGLTSENLKEKVQLSIIGTKEDQDIINIHIEKNQIHFYEVELFNKDTIASKLIEIHADIAFSFQTNLGKFMPIPWIGYIPDFQHKYLTSYFSETEKKGRDKQFLEIYQYADGLIVNSIDTKKDIIKFLNANENTIYSLPMTPFLKEEYMDYQNYKIDDTYKDLLQQRYFIISNQFWMHKNHKIAFEALNSFYKRNEECSDIKLVCTGKLEDYRNPNYVKGLISYIKENNLEEKIILLGLVDKCLQLQLMKSSIAVIQPTLFEGGPGGGATYDAISLGKRVILSDIDINKEIDSANIELFNKESVESLVLMMEKVISLEPNLLESNAKKNKEILGNALLNVFINTLKNKNDLEMIEDVFDYTLYNDTIKKSLRSKSNLSVYKNKGVYSSISLIDVNSVPFFKNVSAEYFTKLFFNKHKILLDTKLTYLEDDIFSMTVQEYFNNYVFAKLNSDSNIYIYADGGHTESLIQNVDFTKFRLKGILSKNPKQDTIESYPVYRYEKNLIKQDTYLLISSSSYENEIFNELRVEIPENQILRIYGY